MSIWSRRAFLRASSGAGALAAAAGEQALHALSQAGAAIAGESAEAAAQNERYWREVRAAFTLDPALINLNNGNSSPSPRLVHEACKRYLDTINLLPVHHRTVIDQRIDAVRRRLAATFGCDAEELAITRNASEALHIAQCGIDLRPGDEVVTTDQDYSRMLWAWDQRARRDGIVLKRIQFPVPTTGEDLLNRFERAMTARTRVLHFCHMTNVTGQLFPVRELCRLARSRGILTIVDGAQTFGQFPVTLRDLECDFYGTSLHKWLMAPHGTGLLYVRREHIDRLWPLQPAINSMRGNIRKFEEVGTRAPAAAAAIADALDFHDTIGAERKAARLRYLTLRWTNALQSHPRVKMLTSLEPGQSWAIATVQFAGLSARALERHLLDNQKIVVAAEYTQGVPGPVFDFEGLRVTPNVYTSTEEIDACVEALRQVLANGLPRA